MQEDQYESLDCHRQDLMAFLETRGLDKAARMKRRPVLRLIKNCGSKLGLIPKF